MQRIELRSDIYRYQDTKGTEGEFKWVDLDSVQWAEGPKFRGRIHTEHRQQWGKEGIYVLQIFEKKDSGPGDRLLVEPNRVEKEWTESELQTLVAHAVEEWEAMARGEDTEMTSVL